MSLYSEYLDEIESRKNDLGLHPKPIDGAELLSEIIAQIKDAGHEHREDSLNFLSTMRCLARQVRPVLKLSS